MILFSNILNCYRHRLDHLHRVQVYIYLSLLIAVNLLFFCVYHRISTHSIISLDLEEFQVDKEYSSIDLDNENRISNTLSSIEALVSLTKNTRLSNRGTIVTIAIGKI